MYRCKRGGEGEVRLSVNDYVACTLEGMRLFFLIDADAGFTVRQHLFQIRPSLGKAGFNELRPIKFTIWSNDYSGIRQLYDASSLPR